ncbi:hypothetical protein Ae406Ps2_6452c [Pseudonocardia sp. Ae406_Ps2]|nr:hypothetical protein Ae331Ps2_6373 [Pseudonocardia sp. Ae331_Ps2]OLL89474.1 hypothetical protein Ae406Ps2_6446c [Pseudonocardia sp. Ae406_Ps2]OLL89480.1 hypothetical protein Ae406Ps2_6452c [Pseudonocardia sp. Ae406_Ps2]
MILRTVVRDSLARLIRSISLPGSGDLAPVAEARTAPCSAAIASRSAYSARRWFSANVSRVTAPRTICTAPYMAASSSLLASGSGQRSARVSIRSVIRSAWSASRGGSGGSPSQAAMSGRRVMSGSSLLSVVAAAGVDDDSVGVVPPKLVSASAVRVISITRNVHQ